MAEAGSTEARFIPAVHMAVRMGEEAFTAVMGIRPYGYPGHYRRPGRYPYYLGLGISGLLWIRLVFVSRLGMVRRCRLV